LRLNRRYRSAHLILISRRIVSKKDGSGNFTEDLASAFGRGCVKTLHQV